MTLSNLKHAVVNSLSRSKFFCQVALGITIIINLPKSLQFNRLGQQLEHPHKEQSAKNTLRIIYSIHVHHKEFATWITLNTNQFLAGSKLLISTSDRQIAEFLQQKLQMSGLLFQIKVCENRGRNVAPFLAIHSDEILQNDVVIHIHSKKTEHAGRNFGSIWKRVLIAPLLGRQAEESIRALIQHEKIGLVYSSSHGLVNALNLNWGLSMLALKREPKLFNLVQAIDWRQPVSFPAGFMFAARVDAIRPLLEKSWEFSDFPKEIGQKDFALQHGIERLIGNLATSRGFEHLIFNYESKEYFRLNIHNVR